VTPSILLDKAARHALADLLLGKSCPHTIPLMLWHQLNNASVAALDCRHLTMLADMLEPDLIYRLREASEKAAYDVVEDEHRLDQMSEPGRTQ